MVRLHVIEVSVVYFDQNPVVLYFAYLHLLFEGRRGFLLLMLHHILFKEIRLMVLIGAHLILVRNRKRVIFWEHNRIAIRDL